MHLIPTKNKAQIFRIILLIPTKNVVPCCTKWYWPKLELATHKALKNIQNALNSYQEHVIIHFQNNIRDFVSAFFNE